jgi:leader peptidase (prepilin peptidase)/N-methyltransferase
MTQLAVILISGVLGLLIGSFLNVVIARVPAGGSIVRPASHCPRCGAEIAGRDNIPVLSWLALRGRCRACRAPISWRYPLVELGTAALFALTVAVIGAHADLPAHLIVAAGFVALGVIDLDTKRLPVKVLWPTFGIAALAFVIAAVVDDRFGDLGRAALGALIGFAVFRLIHAARPDGMGYGDVRLASVCGMALGWHGLADVALGLYGSFVLGALISVPLLALRRARFKSAIPFGPFLVVATMLQILAGGPLADWLRSRY